MEKRLYDLVISDIYSKVMPALKQAEEDRLRESLKKEGCRDAIIVMNGVIIDGHNRYRICKEENIPFAIQEMQFESEAAAILWIVENQIGRRNVSRFAKCELVLPMEPLIRERVNKEWHTKLSEAKRRKKEREAEHLSDLTSVEGGTRVALAELAGVSSGTLYSVKWLLEHADEATLQQLRNDEITIYGAYTMLRKGGKAQEGTTETQEAAKTSNTNETDGAREVMNESPESGDTAQTANKVHNTSRADDSLADDSASENSNPTDYELRRMAELYEKFGKREPSSMPKYGLVVPLEHAPQGMNIRMPDSVYDEPPIQVYGVIPPDNLELRGKQEFAHVRSEIRKSMEYLCQRTTEVLREMTIASSSAENIEALKAMVTEYYNNIIDQLNAKLEGGNANV